MPGFTASFTDLTLNFGWVSMPWANYIELGGELEPHLICIQALNLKRELLTRERGFICQSEADGPLFSRYNIDFRAQHPKIDLFTRFHRFPFRGTILPFFLGLFKDVQTSYLVTWIIYEMIHVGKHVPSGK